MNIETISFPVRYEHESKKILDADNKQLHFTYDDIVELLNVFCVGRKFCGCLHGEVCESCGNPELMKTLENYQIQFE